MKRSDENAVYVWDPLVRVSHWIVAFSALLAYYSHGGLINVHRVAGYLVLLLVIARVAWGFLGTEYARFSSFVASPMHTLRYLRLLVLRKETRSIGHNPAGGAMIVTLLALLFAIGASGWLLDTAAYRNCRPLHSLHGICSDILIGLSAVHVAGVLYASWRHHENLLASMITGRKRAIVPTEINGNPPFK
jgi:cytochrome b